MADSVPYALETRSKATEGDAANCNADAACDGTTKVPNTGHTACRNVLFIHM